MMMYRNCYRDYVSRPYPTREEADRAAAGLIRVALYTRNDDGTGELVGIPLPEGEQLCPQEVFHQQMGCGVPIKDLVDQEGEQP